MTDRIKWERIHPGSTQWNNVPWDKAKAKWGHVMMTITRDGVEEQVSALGFLGVSEDFFHFQLTGDSTDYRIAKDYDPDCAVCGWGEIGCKEEETGCHHQAMRNEK